MDLGMLTATEAVGEVLKCLKAYIEEGDLKQARLVCGNLVRLNEKYVRRLESQLTSDRDPFRTSLN